MAKGSLITQKKYDDVKRLIETNKFTREEIANLLGVSVCTVTRIKSSSNLEEYKMAMRGGKLPKDKPEEKQSVENDEQIKGLQESMDKVNNTLNAIYDILKRYMEV